MNIHTSNFQDLMLKPELLRAVVDCGFEHPSEGNTNILSLANRISAEIWEEHPSYLIQQSNTVYRKEK